jgi:hypothetical protein
VHNGAQMKEQSLDAEVNTRISRQHKKQLKDLALSRCLKVADIVREAIREKLAREVNGQNQTT